MISQELRDLATSVIPPNGTNDVTVVVVHESGTRMESGDWSGLGGRTRYGAGWFDTLRASEPIEGVLLDTPKEASAWVDALKGEGSELWDRKERRRARLAEIEEAEEAARRESQDTERALRNAEKEAIRQEKLAVKREAERKRRPIREKERGAGSSRPSRSSERPSASTGTRSSERPRTKPKA